MTDNYQHLQLSKLKLLDTYVKELYVILETQIQIKKGLNFYEYEKTKHIILDTGTWYLFCDTVS